jgi:transcriptional regulator with XRE-family HTH domain
MPTDVTQYRDQAERLREQAFRTEQPITRLREQGFRTVNEGETRGVDKTVDKSPDLDAVRELVTYLAGPPRVYAYEIARALGVSESLVSRNLSGERESIPLERMWEAARLLRAKKEELQAIRVAVVERAAS